MLLTVKVQALTPFRRTLPLGVLRLQLLVGLLSGQQRPNWGHRASCLDPRSFVAGETKANLIILIVTELTNDLFDVGVAVVYLLCRPAF